MSALGQHDQNQIDTPRTTAPRTHQDQTQPTANHIPQIQAQTKAANQTDAQGHHRNGAPDAPHEFLTISPMQQALQDAAIAPKTYKEDEQQQEAIHGMNARHGIHQSIQPQAIYRHYPACSTKQQRFSSVTPSRATRCNCPNSGAMT
jgi:hypothetical protein